MKTEKNKKGFTLAELLTAVVIIAILIGILMPALNMARNFAKEAKQKVQISSIEVG
jgi:prepilin-type N-terminal cleavage/methylation domain-containing protein